jgi:putative endopeptidase
MIHRARLASTLSLVALVNLTSCQQQSGEQASEQVSAPQAEQTKVIASAPTAPLQLGSGIDTSGFDPSVRPQDDFFDSVNGKWVAETPLPPDRARWGSFDILLENAQKDVRSLVEEVSAIEGAAWQCGTEDPRFLQLIHGRRAVQRRGHRGHPD